MDTDDERCVRRSCSVTMILLPILAALAIMGTAISVSIETDIPIYQTETAQAGQGQ